LSWNSLLKLVIKGKLEEKVEVTGKGGRRGKQFLDDLKKMK
jgi:hypothetical protein